MSFQKFRAGQLRSLTNATGVYALCDLDEVPIYVGKSDDGIRTRVRRHLTSARSDVIANRLVDVWEVAYVWAWPSVSGKASISELEREVFHACDVVSTLMNSKVPSRPVETRVPLPTQRVQIMESVEIAHRGQPRQRFPRQVQQMAALLDYVIEVQDKVHLRRSLKAHFERLAKYYASF